MRHEHTSHVVIVSLMLIVILAVFGFVLFHNPSEAGTRFTTSLSAYPSSAISISEPSKTTTQMETEILFAFLIVIAFLFAVWLIVKIFREIHAHRHGQ